MHDEYLKARKEFLGSRLLCEVGERCVSMWGRRAVATEVHHKRGRGKWLMDESTWVATCRDCHRIIHERPNWAIQNGWIEPRYEEVWNPSEVSDE